MLFYLLFMMGLCVLSPGQLAVCVLIGLSDCGGLSVE